jgi:uncharacterized protein YukE
LVCCTKKNLATLEATWTRQSRRHFPNKQKNICKKRSKTFENKQCWLMPSSDT